MHKGKLDAIAACSFAVGVEGRAFTHTPYQQGSPTFVEFVLFETPAINSSRPSHIIVVYYIKFWFSL